MKRLIPLVGILLLILVIVSATNPSLFDFLQIRQQSPLPDTTTVYAYGANGLVSKQKGSEVSYYHSDNLGSSSLVTDDKGVVKYSTDYYPFGSSLHEEGEEKYTYNSKELDSTGLYYYGARYYDASVGRFISTDPVAGNIYNPQRLNRYSYTLNNPLKYIDPTGAQFEDLDFTSSAEADVTSVDLGEPAPFSGGMIPEIALQHFIDPPPIQGADMPPPLFFSNGGVEAVQSILGETSDARREEVIGILQELVRIPEEYMAPANVPALRPEQPYITKNTLDSYIRARGRVETETGIRLIILSAFRTDVGQANARAENPRAARFSTHQRGQALDFDFVLPRWQRYPEVKQIYDVRRILYEEGFNPARNIPALLDDEIIADNPEWRHYTLR